VNEEQMDLLYVLLESSHIYPYFLLKNPGMVCMLGKGVRILIK